MTSLRGPLTIPDEKRVLSPEERVWFHCSVVEREHHYKLPCDKEAVDLYEVEPGYKVGYCQKHRGAGLQHAQRLGWQKLISEVAA